MPYPYSWTPTRVTPTTATQVAVLTWDNVPALLSTAVAVNAGTITFSLTNPGRYRIVAKVGSSIEIGSFEVDVTGVDVSYPEYLEYVNNDASQGAQSNVPVPLPSLPTHYSVFAMNLDDIITGVITRDVNGAATSASVIWPDGTPGTYTATSLNGTFLGAVDGYTVTYGSPVRLTFTQPAVTRNASGAVTNRPAMTVA